MDQYLAWWLPGCNLCCVCEGNAWEQPLGTGWRPWGVGGIPQGKEKSEFLVCDLCLQSWDEFVAFAGNR